ncbi:DNA-binding transcription factor [Aureococcus anophagefferens]|nr:DNA-binding transcription factor [Aureococcus anophagefferens]
MPPDDLLDGLDVPGLGDPVDLSRIVLDLRDRVEGRDRGRRRPVPRERPDEEITAMTLSDRDIADRADAVAAARGGGREGRRTTASLELDWREQNAQRRGAPRRGAGRRGARARGAAAAGESREKELQRSFSRGRAPPSSRSSGHDPRRATSSPAARSAGGATRSTGTSSRGPSRSASTGCARSGQAAERDDVIMVSMQDRLAGRPLRWTKTHSYGGGGFGPKPAATRPFRHKGRYHDVDLKLFRLADKRNPRDAVVGWSALPLCDPHFAVIKGKFKVPVLRGEVKPHFDRFSMIQDAYVNDLSAWLGNMYVEIRYLPRETIDPEGNLRTSTTSSATSSTLLQLGDTARRGGLRKGHGSTSERARRQGRRHALALAEEARRGQGRARRLRDEPAAPGGRSAGPSPGHGHRAVQALSSEEDEPHFRGKFGDGATTAGLGLHGTDRAAQDVDDDDEAWWTDLRVAGARDHFYFSVAEEPGRRRPPTATAIVITKFKFVWQELFMDLSSDVRAADYAATHNLRWQWARCSRIFLTGNADSWLVMKVAIYGFRAQLWGFEFKYMPDGLKTMEEVGVVGMGGISVLLAFLGLVGVCRLYQSTGSALPDPVSQYRRLPQDYTKNSCDCFEGDAFKLWRRMVDEENGGIIGIFYVVIIYAIHVETFFVPHDFELSVEELNHVIAKAKKWIGPADQRRHVAIATYDLKDPLLPHFKDTSTHVTIYEHALDGAQKVYRHFLRSPDGCITEIFGSNDATQIFGTARPVDHGDGDDDAGGKGKGGAATDDPAALPQLNGYFAGVRPI